MTKISPPRLLRALALTVIPAALSPATAWGQVQWSPFDPTRSPLVADKPGYMDPLNLLPQRGVASDGRGGWYACWGEYTGQGDDRLRVQHLDPLGNPTWGALGLVVVESSPGTREALLYPDGAGGIIVIYSGDMGYIDGQRFDRAGNRLWGPQGKLLVPVEWGLLSASVVIVARDLDGGFYLPYARVDPLGNDDLYLLRFDLNGNPEWPGMGKHVATIDDTMDGGLSAMTRPDGSLDVVFTTNATNIYVQRLDPNGDRVWGQFGRFMSNQPGDNFLFIENMVPDGQGGYMVMWSQRGTSTDAMFGLHIDQNGNRVWTTNQEQLTPWGYYPGRIISDGTGGFWAFLQSAGADGWGDVHIARLNNDRTFALPITPICTAPYRQRAMHLALVDPLSPATSDLWLAWPDGRLGFSESPAFGEIYFQRVSRDGRLHYQTDGAPLASGYGLQGEQYQMRVASDRKQGLLVTWDDFSHPYRTLRCERVPRAEALGMR